MTSVASFYLFDRFLKDATNDAKEFCDCMRVLVGNSKEKAL
jgi:hypothetical protein